MTLSPSRLESVTTCALRWALEQAGGTSGDSGEQTLGTLVHEVAAAVPDGDEAALRAELEARWPALGLGDGWVAAARRRRADAMVERLAAYQRQSGEVLAVEQPFRAELGRVVLRGVVDRLERAGEADDGSPLVRVVDLKTGRTPVSRTDAEQHAQLGAYQLAVDAGAFDEVTPGAQGSGAALVYVGTDQRSWCDRTQPALAEAPDPAWAAGLVEDVARTVSRSAMVATVNDLCRMCPVTRSCPVHEDGRTVGA